MAPATTRTGTRATVQVGPHDPVASMSFTPTSLLFGRLYVSGWAFDPDSSQPVQIGVTRNGNRLYTWTADGTGPVPQHPDRTPIRWAGRLEDIEGRDPMQFCFTALNIGPGADTPMGCYTVAGEAPVGWWDSVSSSPGLMRLTGWTFDRDLAPPYNVQVYVDGRWWATRQTAFTRSDVVATWSDPTGFRIITKENGRGYALGQGSGFDVSVAMPAGDHVVCLSSEDMVEGRAAGPWGGTSLGCQMVSIPK